MESTCLYKNFRFVVMYSVGVFSHWKHLQSFCFSYSSLFTLWHFMWYQLSFVFHAMVLLFQTSYSNGVFLQILFLRSSSCSQDLVHLQKFSSKFSPRLLPRKPLLPNLLFDRTNYHLLKLLLKHLWLWVWGGVQVFKILPSTHTVCSFVSNSTVLIFSLGIRLEASIIAPGTISKCRDKNNSSRPAYITKGALECVLWTYEGP